MATAAKASRRTGTGRLLPVFALVLSQLLLAATLQAGEVAPVFDAGKAPVQGVREPPRMLAANKSVDRIVQDIQKKYGAQVVKQEMVDEEGRKVLKLRLYNDKDGRVWTVRVDPATGKEL